MKMKQLSKLNFYNHFRSKNMFISPLFYSTTTTTTKTESTRNSRNQKGSLDALYRKISPIGDHKVSIVPVLDKWIHDGRAVDKRRLLGIIKELRHYRRYKHALELSMWMTDKRYYPLTYGDVAIRLDLISKVHGIEQVENYFNSVPRQLKSLEVYGALLNCYAHAELVEKAEAVMQQMRDIGLARSTLSYNVLLNLYYKTGCYEKMENLLHEMEEKGIGQDGVTYAIQISAYAANSDAEGIDKILTRMETDHEVLDWSTYSTAANGCIRVGLLDKGLSMLKKSEELISTAKKKSAAYEHILTQYAALGKKDEVLKLCELFDKNLKVYNRGYISMITSLLKFDDIESAEKIFEVWETQNLNYDIRIPNLLIAAYCRKGLFEKAESLFNRVIDKGGQPDAKTWHYLTALYIKKDQMQKAAEAIKQEMSVVKFFWKPSRDSLVAYLEYLKGKGNLEGAEEIIRLVGDKGFVSVDIQERLLNYIQDVESNSQVLIEILRNALDGDEEPSELLAVEEEASDSRNMLDNL
ncbi:pentatricopeptide repeat-containing protein At2g20710, mitochondrial [Ziziphus jujuba]|uniref:Pentatricopeptide repeat-containing protein At2g20710, mitochondrial n=1 Tax=Ziziphus jujuba TaxID=326968 RepID=A0A6P4AVA2_ZIZJJ|nr:pentatricopeptide repeat-containing protein At2g20710, mitochondrial [Ziziphus jujuba]XP_060669040.1 pentatricopeptide repeat-containing protein At2g20710, mitochondrial [Ziziphus jujuba]